MAHKAQALLVIDMGMVTGMAMGMSMGIGMDMRPFALCRRVRSGCSRERRWGVVRELLHGTPLASPRVLTTPPHPLREQCISHQIFPDASKDCHIRCTTASAAPLRRLHVYIRRTTTSAAPAPNPNRTMCMRPLRKDMIDVFDGMMGPALGSCPSGPALAYALNLQPMPGTSVWAKLVQGTHFDAKRM